MNILTTDLHLTDRLEDEYRWDLFSWIEDNFALDQLFILGDLTDRKDNHSAYLVNRIVTEAIGRLAGVCTKIWILKGNHDYIEPSCPFFKFLDNLEGVEFVTDPKVAETALGKTLLLPHTRTPEEDWKSLVVAGEKYDTILCHQTFNGAKVGRDEFKMQSSLSARHFSRAGVKAGKVWSGDIHAPQIVGEVEYVGTPYPVSFGEEHDPAVVSIKGKRARRLPVPSIRKLTITMNEDLEFDEELRAGDQVKIKVKLPRSEFSRWAEIQKEIRHDLSDEGIVIHSIELDSKRQRFSIRDGKAPIKTPGSARLTLESYIQSRGLDEDEALMGHEIITKVKGE